MRKLFILVTMLLVPALANAWSFRANVTNTSAGIANGRYATITVGTTTTTVNSGSKTVYVPGTGTVTLKVYKSADATVTFTGSGTPTTVAGDPTIYTIGSLNPTASVVFPTATTAQKGSITITQPANGLIVVAVGSSKTTSGYSNVPYGTQFTVTAQPNTGYDAGAITVTGATLVVGTTSTYTVDSAAAAVGAAAFTANGTVPAPVTDPVVIANYGCTSCHAGSTPTTVTNFYAGTHNNNGRITPSTSNLCVTCHTASPHTGGASCIGCHAVAQNAGSAFVQDNSGVRAITGEFAKWSHHVTGVTLQNAHCAACHLEGKVVAGVVVIDPVYHMADAKTHLRNADTDADIQWDPAAPNHTQMDNFCMSCHDANGAISAQSAAIRAVMTPAAGKTASATNPFGDTISNRYDKMMRPAVVDVDGQFSTGNASHHAVKGARYTGRTRAAGTRQITAPDAFDNNSSATLPGKRSTIYDAGNFNTLYTPLANAGGEIAPRTGDATLGDDSTLHCGDCHTVGQWKANSAKNMDGSLTAAVIGAHGSNNEYMLRNTNGSDARHTQNTYTVDASFVVTNTNQNGALLVCFNCHAFNKYGSAFNASGAKGAHGSEYAKQGRCNGPGNTLSFNGYTTGAATDGTQWVNRLEGEPQVLAAGENAPDMGNILGIQCANCHNSGADNGYGGIHGSKTNTYTDGMGNTSKHMRFMPGLGNVLYVPGTMGGITGGTTTTVNAKTFTTGGVNNDTNWEQKAASMATMPGSGCYTLEGFREIDGTVVNANPAAAAAGLKGQSVDGGATLPDVVNTWGGCYDHNAAPGGGTGVTRTIVRPVTY